MSIMARPFVHPALEDITLDGLLYALADPTRRAIVCTLMQKGGAMNCTAATPCPLPKSTQSHHFKVLREAGLVRSQREGTAVVNELRCGELDRRFPGLLERILDAAKKE